MAAHPRHYNGRVRDRITSPPLDYVKSVPPNLRDFKHDQMFYIRLLNTVDTSLEPQKRVVVVVGESIVFCDYQNRTIKRVLHILMIEKVLIQKEESANKITRRAWLKVQGMETDYDVLLQQSEFQGFLANEDIKELVHIICTIKRHIYNVDIPVLEEDQLVFSAMARLEKAGAPVISNLGGGLKDMLNDKFSGSYVPPEPNESQLVVPGPIDAQQWMPAPAAVDPSRKEKRQSLAGSSLGQLASSKSFADDVSEGSVLSSYHPSTVSSLEDTHDFHRRRIEILQGRQGEMQRQQPPPQQPQPMQQMQTQQPQHPHPMGGYQQQQHPHHQHPYQQMRPTPLGMQTSPMQLHPALQPVQQGVLPPQNPHVVPQQPHPQPHPQPPPQQQSQPQPQPQPQPPSQTPVPSQQQQHSPTPLSPPHASPPPASYQNVVRLGSPSMQPPVRHEMPYPSSIPKSSSPLPAHAAQPPAPPAPTPPSPAAPMSGAKHWQASRPAAVDAYPDDDLSTLVSSTGAWGPPNRVHGTKLFEAMGEEYARKRMSELLANEAVGGSGASRSPKHSAAQSGQSGYSGSSAADSRRERRRAREKEEKAAEREREREREQERERERERERGKHRERERERERSKGRAVRREEPRDRDSGSFVSTSVDSLASAILSHDTASTGVDVELYDKLRPKGTRMPHTRGGSMPPATSPRGRRQGVDTFRSELREEFWKHYMHTFDTACARSGVASRNKRAASPRGEGQPSPRARHFA